jgi:hypothetical protein
MKRKWGYMRMSDMNCGTCGRIHKCDGKPDNEPCVDYLNEDLKIHELHYGGNVIDMSLSGEPAKLFMISLIEFFKKNGSTNFLTLTVGNKGDKYAVTIQNSNGIDTPAEKIERLELEINNLQEILRTHRDKECPYYSNCQLECHGIRYLSEFCGHTDEVCIATKEVLIPCPNKIMGACNIKDCKRIRYDKKTKKIYCNTSGGEVEEDMFNCWSNRKGEKTMKRIDEIVHCVEGCNGTKDLCIPIIAQKCNEGKRVFVKYGAHIKEKLEGIGGLTFNITYHNKIPVGLWIEKYK